MKHKYFIEKLFAILLVVSIVSAIFILNQKKNKSQELELYLLWEPQAQFLGYYIAKEKGFFKDYNLNVTIRHNLAVGDSMQVLAKNKNAYAITQFINYLDASASYPNISLHSIISSGCNLGWVSWSKEKDQLIDNLEKNKVYSWWGSHDILLKTLLKSHGKNKINKGDIQTKFPHSLGTKDSILVMNYNENRYYQDDLNRGAKFTSYCDLNLPIYEDVLIGQGSHSDTTIKLVSAIWKGWSWAIEHKNEALKILMKRRPRKGMDMQIYQLDRFLKNITNDGYLNKDIKRLQSTLNKIEKLPEVNSNRFGEIVNNIKRWKNLRNIKNSD